jgi:UDP-N-acetylglucosamine 2-epimerase
MPAVHLVIKPHPAETAAVYQTVAAGARNVHIAPAGAALPALLAAARAVMTVNSTVAIDALTFGVPAVVIGLPNNLTPFVDAGLMLGAGTAEEIRSALSKVLYNQEFRSTIEREATAGRSGGDGQAAARSAEAILALAQRGRP